MAAKKTTRKKEAAPAASEAPKEKKLGLFDIIGDLSYEKRDLVRNSDDPEVARKAFNAYMTNKAFSYHASSIIDANIMNQLSYLDPQLQYDYFLFALRPERRFSKWFKPDENATLHILAERYGVNLTRAQEIMTVLTASQLATIVEQYANKGGVPK